MKLELIEKMPNRALADWVYEVLRSNIIKLHLPPGSAVSEAEIAGKLGVSRTPVRETFIRLVKDGLMEIYSQKGSFITLIDNEQAEEARFVRRVLEKAVILEACQVFPEEDSSELKVNLGRQQFCVEEKNYEQMFFLDNEFHRLIYRGCRKERVWLHIKKLDYNLDRLRILRLSSPFTWDDIINQHHQIARLIIDRNPDKVDELIDNHLTRVIFDKLTAEYPQYFK